jgi:GH24 family phage-related lysozyme (muramidase)
MNNKEKRLILPLFVFWSLIVSLGIMSWEMYTYRLSEKENTSYHETMARDMVQVAYDVPVKKKAKLRKVSISKEGKEHIKSFESLSFIPYCIDDSSRYSIGYGHLIKANDPTWIQERIGKYKISKKDAEDIFAYDIKHLVNPALNRIFNELHNNGVNTEELSQGFVDGLGSLIYNCGEEGVKKTEFYSLLKRGKVDQAIAKVEKTHVYMRGHYIRRLAEMELMNS